jgi:ribosome-associated protein
MIRVTRDIWLDENELDFSFVRSGGPGGQNVNKVATAVELRFDARRSPNLPDRVKNRLLSMAGKKATRRGEIVLFSRTHRSQERNRQEAVDRLLRLIRRAAERPKPRKRTRPSKRSKERRLEEKKRRSKLKKLRKPVKREPPE